MKETKDKFAYQYSAPTERERKTAEEIRARYAPEEETTDKLSQLQRLDKKASQPPMIVALSFGVVGILIFGTGLTMILEWTLLLYGCLVALLGLLPVGFAYPVYRKLAARGRKKYGAQILKLSEEILKESEENDENS
ncbi:MAG: APC family permease [Clostridia bacterium]|nr:APC family permease [Clostridia bacterium]